MIVSGNQERNRSHVVIVERKLVQTMEEAVLGKVIKLPSREEMRSRLLAVDSNNHL